MKIITSSLLVLAALAATQPAVARGTSDTVGTHSNADINAGYDSSWNSQNSYWRDNYTSRPYYNNSQNYSMYEPAYRYGVDLYNRYPNKPYDQLNCSELSNGWGTARGNSTLSWNEAQNATRDAYNQMYNNRNSTTYTR